MAVKCIRAEDDLNRALRIAGKSSKIHVRTTARGTDEAVFLPGEEGGEGLRLEVSGNPDFPVLSIQFATNIGQEREKLVKVHARMCRAKTREGARAGLEILAGPRVLGPAVEDVVRWFARIIDNVPQKKEYA